MSRFEKLRNGTHTGEPCHYCRRPMLSTKLINSKHKEDFDVERSATVDHIIPVTFGGSNDADNIVIACQRCNGLKGSTSYEIFIEFARVILTQYPNAPTYVLRLCLRQFIDSLAEIAIRNKRETKRALSLALLKLGEDMRKH